MEKEEIERPKKTLPPDYVSWAQLREKWLLKQQQQKQELEAKLNNQETNQTVTLETQPNGVQHNKKNRRNWNNKKKNQPLVDDNQQNGEFSCEIAKKNGVVSNGTKVYRSKLVDETKGGYNTWRNRKRFGGNRFGNGEKVDDSSKGHQKSKALEEISESEVCLKVDCFEVTESDDGFYNKSDNFVGMGSNDGKLVENGAKDDEKVEPRSEFGRPWWSGNEGRKIGRGRKSGKRKGVGGNRLEKSKVESSKGDKKGKDSDEMCKSEVLEVGLKLEGLKVIDGHGRKEDSIVGVGLNDEQIVGNGSRAKNAEKGGAGNAFGKNKNLSENIERTSGRPDFGNRRMRNKMAVGGNRSEKNVAELHGESSKTDEKVQGSDGMSKSKVNGGNVRKDDGIAGVGLNSEQIVGNENRAKNDEKGGAGNGFGKNRYGSGNIERTSGRPAFGNRRLGNKMANGGNRSGKNAAELHTESTKIKIDEKEQDLDGMSKSEVGIKPDGLKVIDHNGKDDSVVGVGVNDDQIADNEKGEAGNEYGKYGNRSVNGGRKCGRAGYVDRRLGSAVGNRNYAGSGRFRGRRMDGRDNVKVWVKKEEKSSANAAQLGFNGI